MRQCVGAVEGCRARTQCEERCEDGEHMCSPLHYRLPDTTQQHQTHHGYSYPSSSHLSSHWVRALQPSTPLTHCLTALYLYSSYTASIQQLYRLYSYTAIQQLYSIHPLQHPSERRQGEASSQGVQEVRFATKEGVPNSLAQNNNKNIVVLATGTSWHLKFRPGAARAQISEKNLRKIGTGLPGTAAVSL